jgi:flavin reductase (DIM6/NTAB) family NADH-FMN oxidoreductase RutF
MGGLPSLQCTAARVRGTTVVTVPAAKGRPRGFPAASAYSYG